MAKWLAAVALAGAVVSCGRTGGRTAPDSASDRATTLETTITAAMQGAQLDVWGGGDPAAGGTTSMFVHRGDRAVEAYWTTDGWCVSRLFAWSVEHAVSATRFDVRYQTVRAFPDCMADADDDVLLEVYDALRSDLEANLVGAYPALDATWTTRTKCSTDAVVAAPCGFPAAAAATAPWI